jgi:hypothetical protein
MTFLDTGIMVRAVSNDSLHATFARRKKAVQIVTRNPSHFQHVAPDIEVLTP